MKDGENSNPLDEFVAECNEIIDRISKNLAQSEGGVLPSEKVEEMYRDMHTLKGTAYLFGFSVLGHVAHAMENCLDPLRQGTQVLTSQIVSALYESIDVVSSLVKNLIESGKEGYSIEEVEGKIEALSSVMKGFQQGEQSKAPEEKSSNNPPEIQSSLEKGNVAPKEPSVEPPQTLDKEAGPSVSKELASSKDSDSSDAAVSDNSVRVKIDLLDKLMNLVGEMVLIRNQVIQFSKHSDDLKFHNLSQRLNTLTSDLQEQAMRTRMQPLGIVLRRFHRMVRDLGKKFDKDISLKLVGEETELDRSLLQSIKDPLTHVVRNCCDHGIEPSEERKKSDKTSKGQIVIRAYHEGGQVCIEISDDGRGLDPKKIIQRAVESKLIQADEASMLSERQIYELTFEPGFSTVEEVSSVSGRGVGMDVVKTNVEKIGGSVEISSVLGEGSRFLIKIPLTLAIVPALIVRSGPDRFVIPQVKLLELVRVEKGKEEVEIEQLQGKWVCRLRGDLMPLLHLNEVLGVGSGNQLNQVEGDQINIVVLDADGLRFGLIVDEIHDTADIVVKPLGSFLKVLNIFSGATIMGDGSVSLILDVMGIAEKACLDTGEEESGSFGENQFYTHIKNDRQEYLIFSLNSKGQYAVPLFLVRRLEEFSENDLEYSGEQPVFRYRNGILPVIFLNQFFGFPKQEANSEKMSVIVVSRGAHYFGLVVDEIVDIVEGTQDLDRGPKDHLGIMGNLLHQERVVVVVDIQKVIQEKSKEMGISLLQSDERELAANQQRKILFVEDTPFFRRHISQLLSEEGFGVQCFNNGKEALSHLEAAEDEAFDLIVSDIEMPEMNGLQLVQELRKIDKYRKFPIFALTTKTGEKYRDDGLQSGFDEYIDKLDTHSFISKIRELFSNEPSNDRGVA